VQPCPPELAELFPWPGGIRRGATVAAVGSTSLLMALMASPMAAGSWAAVVGMPHFGALAAGVDYRLPLDHLEDGGFADSGTDKGANPLCARAEPQFERRVRRNRAGRSVAWRYIAQ
jgi:hypothetical protein